MNIGFIGAGNMATAILKGITKSGAASGENIYIYDVDNIKLEARVEEFHANKARSAEELIKNSDTVILAVKPNVFSEFLPTIKETVQEKSPLVISIAAGKTISSIEELLGTNIRIIRIMPNINAVVRESMSAFCGNENVNGDDRRTVETLFSSVGIIMPLEEKYFPVFGVVAGCAPAFGYMFIDALARGGVKNGLNKEASLRIAAQTVLGSAKMILESSEHPYELIDRVCSPGGTTIEGVFTLQNNGFEATVIKAVDAGVEKDSIIGKV